MIRHLVFLRFPTDMPQASKDDLFTRLADLQGVIDGILDFGHRPNASPETAVRHGFGDMFWFDMTDEAARDAYLIHPEHQAVGRDLVAALRGGTDGIFVCDIEI